VKKNVYGYRYKLHCNMYPAIRGNNSM